MPEGGVLLVLWGGHGIESPTQGVKMLCADSRSRPASGLSAVEVVEPCATSGAEQILLIGDTCFPVAQYRTQPRWPPL
jgi:hypothetical protein